MSDTINMEKLPKHIAMIMDGNGRWAKKRGLPRKAGHKAGSESLKRLLEESAKLGIENVTVYAFSTENWSRPADEVAYLMNLMEEYIDDNLNRVKTNDYRIKIIGNMNMLEPYLVEKIEKLVDITKDKKGLCFTIALSYGGRDEIIRAFKKIARECKDNNLDIEDINEQLIGKYLDTGSLPDPDLIIRTSGEERLSNFLTWQSAYSEIYFSQKYWPDFTIADLKEAIINFQNRERRFGKA